MAEAVEEGRTGGSRVRRWLIGFGIGLLAGAVLYGLGWWQGRQAVDRLEAQIRTVQMQYTRALTRARIMEARAALYRTAIDLDQRNFGTANGHLREAAAALASAPDTTRPGLSSLRAAVAGTDLNVAADLEAQRNRVLEYAARLDAISGDTLAAPAADTVH